MTNVFDQNVFIDPSVLFDKDALDKLSTRELRRHFKLWTSDWFTKSSLDDISDREYSEMQMYYGKSVNEFKQVSKDTLIYKLSNIDLIYYSKRIEFDTQGLLEGLDLDRMEQLLAVSGWRETIDINELWFLATHSTILSRIKSRERDLSRMVSKHLRKGKKSMHLTVESAGSINQEYIRLLSGIGKWLVWLASEPYLAHYLSNNISAYAFWAVSNPAVNPVIVSFKL